MRKFSFLFFALMIGAAVAVAVKANKKARGECAFSNTKICVADRDGNPVYGKFIE